jgi:XTP/dITP diphosphohydrolase
MPALLFATNNEHKLREIKEIAGKNYLILGLKDVGITTEIPETQETLEGNASQKARFIYDQAGMDCFADDTGLEIEALEGRPGVYSARYAGDGCSFDDNIDKILKELEGVENRNVCFRCVVALILDGKEHLFEGRIPGKILKERQGEGGFGYDPVFLPEGYDQTFAEMQPDQKNKISHRGLAVKKLFNFMKKM